MYVICHQPSPLVRSCLSQFKCCEHVLLTHNPKILGSQGRWVFPKIYAYSALHSYLSTSNYQHTNTSLSPQAEELGNQGLQYSLRINIHSNSGIPVLPFDLDTSSSSKMSVVQLESTSAEAMDVLRRRLVAGGYCSSAHLCQHCKEFMIVPNYLGYGSQVNKWHQSDGWTVASREEAQQRAAAGCTLWTLITDETSYEILKHKDKRCLWDLN